MADPEGVAMPVDPYEAVLADLRAKRDDIDRVIKTLESYRSGAPVASVEKSSAASAASSSDGGGLGPGAFLGMSIVDASKTLLAHRRQQLTNQQILTELKAGGVVMNASDPLNVVGSILTRRFSQVGDIVRVGRGTWGLKEWYPNRSFKKEAATAVASPADAGNSNLAPELQ